MFKKALVGLMLVANIFVVSDFTIATGGRVRASSVIKCNGVYYGQHGNGHWHRVVKRGKYWYATGNEISQKPC